MVETISQMRESGQTGRGEVSLRHSEFGLVSMRVIAGEGELQARLASRDPGFFAAAQSALADKIVSDRMLTQAADAGQPFSRQQDHAQSGQNSQHRDWQGNAGASQDGQPGGEAQSQQKSAAQSETSTGEHGQGALSADDHTPSKTQIAAQRASGLFA